MVLAVWKNGKIVLMMTGEDALMARPHSKIGPCRSHPRKKAVWYL